MSRVCLVRSFQYTSVELYNKTRGGKLRVLSRYVTVDKLEPGVGDDPTTYGLQNRGSTNMSYPGKMVDRTGAAPAIGLLAKQMGLLTPSRPIKIVWFIYKIVARIC